MMEEAKKRDHRVLGKKLDLFSIQEARFCWAALSLCGCSVFPFCYPGGTFVWGCSVCWEQMR